MRESYLSPKDVAERLNISVSAARARMAEMPGCVNVGQGKTQILRVPESGLEAWTDNRILVFRRSSGKIARKPLENRRKEERIS